MLNRLRTHTPLLIFICALVASFGLLGVVVHQTTQLAHAQTATDAARTLLVRSAPAHPTTVNPNVPSQVLAVDSYGTDAGVWWTWAKDTAVPVTPQINATIKTTAYTITYADGTVLGSTTAGGFSFTLPAAAGVPPGWSCVVKQTGTANTLTVARAGSDTIDGATSYTGLSAQYKYVRLQSDGVSKWYVIANN